MGMILYQKLILFNWKKLQKSEEFKLIPFGSLLEAKVKGKKKWDGRFKIKLFFYPAGLWAPS